MNLGYLDASSLAGYSYPDHRADKFRAVLAQINDPAISSLVELEFASLTARRVRMGELNVKHAHQVMNLFDFHLRRLRYHFLPIEDSELIRAKRWIRVFDVPLRTADAIHLSIAFAHSIRIVTGDKELARAAKYHGVNYILID